MKRKTRRLFITSLLAVTSISAAVFTLISQADNNSSYGQVIQPLESDSSETKKTDYKYIPPTLVGQEPFDDEPAFFSSTNKKKEAFVPATEIDLEPSSITVFVNKEHALPKTYEPDNLVHPNILFDINYQDERTLLRQEAAEAIEKCFADAEEEGIILYGISGYRSYERQKHIFTNNIRKKGKDYTLLYSAVPGTSEHQTGLAIDVSSKSLGFRLVTSFAESPEGIWLAKHAHLYGYIIRYPKDKAEVTGYAYEPWHIRYVGVDLATYLYNNDLTLDEYYNYVPSKDFDFETLYSDLINYIPPRVTIIPIDGEGEETEETDEFQDEDTADGDTKEEDSTDSDTQGKVTPSPAPVPATPTPKPVNPPKNPNIDEAEDDTDTEIPDEEEPDKDEVPSEGNVPNGNEPNEDEHPMDGISSTPTVTISPVS